MKTAEAEVKNKAGIHARPSALIIKKLKECPAKVHLSYEGETVGLDSIMSLLALGLHQGAKIRLEVEGEQEEEWLQEVITLFETHYDFPPRN